MTRESSAVHHFSDRGGDFESGTNILILFLRKSPLPTKRIVVLFLKTNFSHAFFLVHPTWERFAENFG